MKNIIKYILIFIITVALLFAILVLATKIPKSMIIDNLEESAEYYKTKLGIHKKDFGIKKEELHYFADSILLNIMFFSDSNNAMKSIMEARFYKVTFYDTNYDFITAVEKGKEANNQYIRYWHGSLAILRPLMTIFNIEQIYKINIIIYWILFLILMFLLLKKYKILAIIFAITSSMVTLYSTPYCLEYIWTVFIMFITSIISILIEKRSNQKIYLLYFIVGILTCFLDFLTTETLTILIPVLFVILIRNKENRLNNIKDCLKFLIVSGLVWFFGYALMWGAKWIIASIVLNINALEYVKDNAMVRINWNYRQDITIVVYIKMLLKNILKIYPLNELSNDMLLITISASILEIILILRIINRFAFKNDKNKKTEWIKFILLMIAIIPYVRFCFLANHANNHSFFTYRAQLPSIISTCFIIIYSIDRSNRQKLISKIMKKRKNKNE